MQDYTFVIWGAVIVVTTVIIFLLWKNGWLSSLQKIRFGNMEVERFDQKPPAGNKQEDLPDGVVSSGDDNVTAGEIDVRVKDNRFKGDVGDIGGVIVKSEQKSKGKKN